MNRRGSGRATVIDRSTNRYRDQVRCSRSSYSLCSQTSLVCTCTCDTVCSSMRTYTYIYIFAATRYKKRRFVLLSNENALKDANATFSLYAFPFRGTASLALSLSLDQSLPTYMHADTHAHAHILSSIFFFCKNFYSPFFVSFVYVSYLVCSYCYTLHTTTFASLFLLSNSSLFVTFFFSFSSLFFYFFFLNLLFVLVTLTAIKKFKILVLHVSICMTLFS